MEKGWQRPERGACEVIPSGGLPGGFSESAKTPLPETAKQSPVRGGMGPSPEQPRNYVSLRILAHRHSFV
ncbi:protein of unknown function [Candidatus Methylocalor cossyra]|uniref:Uncharacterized protein n=1 Tax=Candidatus Methylocalor cossyra TaxID=3108543 RepID=A0ABP1C8L6_9GAMM